MYESDIEITPNVGWANIQLGNSLSEVRAALATNGHAYELDNDEFTIDIYGPETTFYFDDSNPKCLVQIVFYDKDHRVFGEPVIGLPLDEAMLPFHVTSFQDTLWSLVSIEEEYQKGKPLSDSKRTTKFPDDKKLECATLWIKNQGVGLVMLFGVVHAIAIRRSGDEPKVGCGCLNADTMKVASKVQPQPLSKNPPNVSAYQSKPKTTRAYKTLRRVVFSSIALILVAVPAFIVYRDLEAWKQSIAVVGVVVETKSEGPFINEVVVEYFDLESSTHRVSILSTYVTARDVGDEVDLMYLPNRPDRAMTRIQARDEGWSIHPYWLFGSVGLSTFFLHWAFPEYIRLNSRKRR